MRETALATATPCLTAADLAEPGILERLLRLPRPQRQAPRLSELEA